MTRQKASLHLSKFQILDMPVGNVIDPSISVSVVNRFGHVHANSASRCLVARSAARFDVDGVEL